MTLMVFDGQFVQALYDARGGDTLLVTFNEMESFANGRNYWGQAAATNLNMSCVGIMTKAKNWFPSVEMNHIVPAIADMIKQYQHVVAYGFSQGGYAAIKYSMKIAATHVLAFSPQWTIDPKFTKEFDCRFSAHFDGNVHNEMHIMATDISGNVWIFVDPYETADVTHAKIIEKQVGYKCIIPCYNLGHGTVRAIASTNALARVLAECKLSNPTKSSMVRIIREQKKGTFAYYHA